MTKPYYCGIKIVFGVPDSIKPIVGAPEGRQKIKFRNTGTAKLFVKTADGIASFVLTDNGETWGVIAQVRNVRPRPPIDSPPFMNGSEQISRVVTARP